MTRIRVYTGGCRADNRGKRYRKPGSDASSPSGKIILALIFRLTNVKKVCILVLSLDTGGLMTKKIPTKRARVRTNFYLTTLQTEKLKKLSAKTGLTASEILRRAIDEYWERQKSKKEGG